MPLRILEILSQPMAETAQTEGENRSDRGASLRRKTAPEGMEHRPGRIACSWTVGRSRCYGATISIVSVASARKPADPNTCTVTWIGPVGAVELILRTPVL